MVAITKQMKIGSVSYHSCTYIYHIIVYFSTIFFSIKPEDFQTFTSAVIDDKVCMQVTPTYIQHSLCTIHVPLSPVLKCVIVYLISLLRRSVPIKSMLDLVMN